MSDNNNTNNQVPRVIKGTGFYTPMDIVPGETPAADSGSQNPSTVGEMVGQPTPMNVSPPDSATQQPSAEPPQSGGDGNAQNS
jgi:hypothetical protein